MEAGQPLCIDQEPLCSSKFPNPLHTARTYLLKGMNIMS